MAQGLLKGITLLIISFLAGNVYTNTHKFQVAANQIII